ncbi:2-oxo-4-hydroxy-4-carboxy-5-ureidoimidazoline decarboxylase [Neptunicella sp. SCSIO 80796]|uniref:2-oxo-4-hydroxy-4-carboxy-5-ureidoimidazoline decarboxylase n=1 Tax=Neptunicella plasticusilytica TaxID=3117012 RepID=UPI003A4D3C97
MTLDTMTIEQLNTLPGSDATDWFMQSCAAQNWCEQMVNGRPYADISRLMERAEQYWLNAAKQDYLEAFSAHPMIGDLSSLQAKYTNTQTMAGAEQSGTAGADPKVLAELAELNQRYYQQNGFIFIVCATGLSAEAMLEKLQRRIHNSTETEMRIAAAEQLKITQLRLAKNLSN